MDIIGTMMEIFSQFQRQSNLFAKMLVCYSIYFASIDKGNRHKVAYKIAFFLGIQSLLSSQLISYSSIINLKYTMNHYNDPEAKGITMVMNYFMLTCFGVLTTVIPMQLLEMVRLIVFLFAAIFCCG